MHQEKDSTLVAHIKNLITNYPPYLYADACMCIT
jgi:hypothetical protein